jgi:hypothetical protein
VSLQSSADRSDRSDKSRRMGIVSRKHSDSAEDKTLKNNRYSHLRGLSHGSALRAGSPASNGDSSRPLGSPGENSFQRQTYTRRLSSLPERKRQSVSPDVIVEGARSLWYALNQLHGLLHGLIDLCRDGSDKRTSLERVFYNASTHLVELDRDIISYDTHTEGEEEETSPRTNETTQNACLTAVSAYIHVCSLLSRNIERLVDNCDSRHVRSLLLAVYGSLAEVRNAGTGLSQGTSKELPQLPTLDESDGNADGTIRPVKRDKSVTPTRERPGFDTRSRSATIVQSSQDLRVSTDLDRNPNSRPFGRSATISTATPRSGNLLSSPTAASSVASSSAKLASSVDFSDEDRLFEKIFFGLQQSTELAIATLPTVNNHFINAMRISAHQGDRDNTGPHWQVLCQRCSIALQTAEVLKERLSQIHLREPGIRTQSAFWELCNAYIGVRLSPVFQGTC